MPEETLTRLLDRTPSLRPLFEPPISASNLPDVDPEVFLAYSKVFHDAKRYSNRGPLVQTLERRLAEFHEVEHCVAVASGFWGLVIAAATCARPGRRHAVLPSLTYRRMSDAVAWAGLVPRFCEVDPPSLAMTAQLAEPMLDDDVALVIGVHPMVNCCDVEGLEALANSRGIPIIFDAVESSYEMVAGRRVGGFGEVEVFSLHASKLISGMEGGYLTTNNSDLAARLRLRTAFGFNGYDNVEMLGMNAKLNEIHAAYALACLDRLDEQIVWHYENYQTYLEELRTVDGLRLVAYDPATRPSYRQIVIELVDTWPHSRADTVASLNSEGALARPYYSPALHQASSTYPRDVRSLPLTDSLSERFILMPSGARVSSRDVRRLVQYLRHLRGVPSADVGRTRPDDLASLSMQKSVGSPRSVPRRLAIEGGLPAFEEPIPVGQLYFPGWNQYQRIMLSLLDAGWYTNSGPLSFRAERELAQLYQVGNVITFVNATTAIMALAKASGISGPVVVPGFTFAATAQALTWAGLEVVFCDVDPTTHQVTAKTLRECLESYGGPRPDAVLAVDLWGGATDSVELEKLCRSEGLVLMFDSAQATGAKIHGKPVGGGGVARVFSFHATKILSATEGGCICTDDDELAHLIRNVRSSYGASEKRSVAVTLNGRFSEAQAALVLSGIPEVAGRIERNRLLLDAYRTHLADTPGVTVHRDPDGVVGNSSYAVLEIDCEHFGLERDKLVSVLKAENVLARRYFTPGVHRTPPYTNLGRLSLPVTEDLCSKTVQLPLGSPTDLAAVERIASIVRTAHRRSRALSALVP